MFKRIFLLSFAFLAGYILIFTLYRASVGYGPLNFRAIIKQLGSSFSATSEQLNLLFCLFDQAKNGLLNLVTFDVVENPAANEFLNLLSYAGQILRGLDLIKAVFWFCEVLLQLLKLFVLVIQDIGDVLRIIGFFVVSGSPYPVQPYFPVG